MCLSHSFFLTLSSLLFLPKFSCYQYIYYKNRKFPFDDTSRVISFVNKTNVSNPDTKPGIITSCLEESKGDMICDSMNNNLVCEFDGGDCCKKTCLLTCEKLGLSGSDCKCGEESYNCIMPDNKGCGYCNSDHGKCESNMNSCYKEDEDVLQGLSQCIKNTFTQGNWNTSNLYCGKDPLIT